MKNPLQLPPQFLCDLRQGSRSLIALSLVLASCATGSVSSLDPTGERAVPPTPSPQPSPAASPPQVEEVEPVTVVEGLEHPWGMAWLPNGDLLITERPGRLRRVQAGRLDPTPIEGVPEVLAFRQGGLLDIALHPAFEDNRWVYLAYAHGTREANRTRVARARLGDGALTDWTVIFETNRAKPDGQHFGARLLWLPDRTLLVALGDGGNPPVQLDGDLIRNQAQNPQSHLGTVVRLRDDGSVPADNPFVGNPKADPLVWSYGHRNIQGLALDGATGQVWATEHGARGGDELNRLQPGQNYGWPRVTYSEEYSGGPITTERSRPGMVDPITYWTPAIAPSGLAVYRGDRYPQWQGQIFAGGLVSQDVRRIEVNSQGTVVSQTPIPIGQRVRDVRQGPDGLLYVLTDDPRGRLIRLDPVGS
ncbi:MAG TPA: PQQ-dependent sugar dehydrogenase [Leptolyngbyaceae cyanobacterium M65_K2018_010]|nr:PQQ-dependent sugar dehydrogenase [Leptolyngbyaceae cyanobacterium M65_K2018_010]